MARLLENAALASTKDRTEPGFLRLVLVISYILRKSFFLLATYATPQVRKYASIDPSQTPVSAHFGGGIHSKAVHTPQHAFGPPIRRSTSS
ncbi:hypothetical protein BDN72DRAFT_835708 [Pluteus cervinus]|uniref:Uncharacterized protein n=1 Tax=Pluteus cervinus TaxID=181527 RepID=A0ACD3B3F4_9AGAR|nr:hypothetical protein BDN72DRAFT_835708 [Pluteus cervinus]